MILSGDHVKILKGYYKGEIGIIKSFDGFSFRVKLLKRALEIKIDENEIEKIVEKNIEENIIKITIYDGTELILKDIDLRYTSNSLRNNGYFKGLYTLGKDYSKEQYTNKYYRDYFIQQILKIKNFNEFYLEKGREILEIRVKSFFLFLFYFISCLINYNLAGNFYYFIHFLIHF